MMQFFDYIFYRMYIAFKKRNEEEVWGPSLYAGMCFMSLFSSIWLGMEDLLFGKTFTKVNVYIVSVVFMLLFYIRYKRRRDKILQKYRNSPYNKKIHMFFIHLTMPTCFIVGVFIAVLMDKFIMKPYHLEGIVGRWLGIM